MLATTLLFPKAGSSGGASEVVSLQHVPVVPASEGKCGQDVQRLSLADPPQSGCNCGYCWLWSLSTFPLSALTIKRPSSISDARKGHVPLKESACCMLSLSRILPLLVTPWTLFVTTWTVLYQDPLSMGFSRQEYWSRLPFPSLGNFPTQRLNPGPLHLLHW